MTDKVILFVDADFVNDLFGRTNFDQAAGEQALAELTQKYDIRITSTVFQEIDQVTNGYDMGGWFENNNIPKYNTSAFDNLSGDKGERSITAILDPNYIDNDLGATDLHDASLPSLSDTDKLQIATRDQNFFSGQPSGANTHSTQAVIEASLLDETLAPDTYKNIYDNSNGSFGSDTIRTAETVTAEHLNTKGYVADVDGTGHLTVNGEVVEDLAHFFKHAGIIGSVFGVAVMAADAKAEVDQGDYQGAAEVIAKFLGENAGGALVGFAVTAAAAPVIATFGVSSLVGAVLVGGLGFVASIGGGIAGGEAVESLIQAAKDLGIIDNGIISDYNQAIQDPLAALSALPDDVKEGLMPVLSVYGSDFIMDAGLNTSSSILATPEQIEQGLNIPDIDVVRALPANDWFEDRRVVFPNGSEQYLMQDNDQFVLPDSTGAFDLNEAAYSMTITVRLPVTGQGFSDTYYYDSAGNVITGAPNNSIFDFSTDFYGGAAQGGSSTIPDWENGLAIDNGGAAAWMDPLILNEDGAFNSLPAGIVTDNYRPGAGTLVFDGLSGDIKIDIDLIFDSFQSGIADAVNSSVSWFTGLVSDWASTLNVDPLVLDMDGDGVELVSYENAIALFDVDDDGFIEKTGWVSSDDALLVKDLNGDGVINDITETLSEFYNGGTYLDGLDALAALDSNGDGMFDANDAEFGNLRVWQDGNGNAQTDSGELQTLSVLGITAISVDREIVTRTELEGNPVLSQSVMTMNGQSHAVAAVDFATNPVGYEWNNILEGLHIATENGVSSGLLVEDEIGATIDLAIINNDSEPDNDVNSVVGNIGNDVLLGDANSNWLMGAVGSDTLIGGAGDDFLVIDAEDDMANIDAGAGFDILQVAGPSGVAVTLADVNAEVVIGGDGQDTLISGSASNVFMRGGGGDDVLIGGSADDALSGEDGDDFIDGGLGDDILRGHRGQDVIIGNIGEDMLDGGAGDDELYGGDDEDLLIGGDGNDKIYGGSGYDVAQFSGAFEDYGITFLSANSIQIRDKVGNRDGVDTLIDVEALNFGNVLELRLNYDSPVAANDVVPANGSGPFLVLASNLLSNDVDLQGQALSITSLSDVVGGSAYIDGNGDVMFAPDASYSGVKSFKYTIEDSDHNQGVLITDQSGQGPVERKATVYLEDVSHPADPLFYEQWYLSDSNIIPIWSDYTGSGINIALYEVGGQIGNQHVDLIRNLSQETLDSADEAHWHATLVAGVIAADRNDEGAIGVAYGSTLTGVVFDTENGVYQGDLTEFSQYDIINNSWGWALPFVDNFDEFPDAEALFWWGAFAGRDGLGTVMIFAGGNERPDGGSANVNSWSNNEYVITVGGINKETDLASFEILQAPFSNPGSNILVSAPASYIKSTSLFLENEDGSTFGADYDVAEGTSFAAPIVSGTVALMLEANQNLGYRDVQEILAYSARIVDDANTVWQTNGASNWNGGGLHFSHDYGFGEIDALAAVRLAETWHKQETYGNRVVNTVDYESILNQTITDGGTISDTISVASGDETGQVEYVLVTLDFIHSQVGDLIVKLTSPDGTESILLDRLAKAPSDPNDRGHGAEDMTFTFGSWAHMGELSGGDWTLEVTDAVTGAVGTLRSWKIDFIVDVPEHYVGLAPPANSTFIYTDEYQDITDPARQVLQDTSGSASDWEDDVLNVAAMGGDMNINLNPGTTSSLAGKNLDIASDTYVDRLFTGDGDDILQGNDMNNLLYGGRGDDVIGGGVGDDWLMGKTGVNVLTGGTGKDRFVAQNGDEGTQTIQDFDASAGDVVVLANYDSALDFSSLTLVQETGNTRVTLPDSQELLFTNVLSSELTASDFVFDPEFSILTVRLWEYTGTSNNENISMGGVYLGHSIYGLDGDDTLLGSRGNDTIYGGAGNDTLVGAPSTSEDQFAGEDILYGGDGDDVLYGAGLSDILVGGTGNDYLYGDRGTDLIYLEGGQDVAYGEEGIDRFVILDATSASIADGNNVAMDIVFDFNPGQETIDLRNFEEVTSFNDLTFESDSWNLTDPETGQSVPTPVTFVSWGDIIINYGADQYFTLVGVADSSELSADNFIFHEDEIPEAEPDAYFITEDTTLQFSLGGLLANDSDQEDGSPVFSKFVTNPEHGVLVDLGGGDYDYIPDSQYYGYDKLTYEVVDSAGGTATATVSIAINSVGDAPSQLMPDLLKVRTGLQVSYKTDFFDADNDLITVTATLQDGSVLPSWLNFNSDTQRFSGVAPVLPEDILLRLAASDGTNVATHDMTLSVVTRAPVAFLDDFQGTEGQDVTGNLLADNNNGADMDYDGDALSVVTGTFTTAQGGTVTITNTVNEGDFTYTPVDGDFNGQDSFTYTLLDNQGGSDIGQVVIDLQPINDLPVIVANTGGTTDEDVSLVLTTSMLNASDVDSVDADLEFHLTALPAHGTFEISGVQAIVGNFFTLAQLTAGSVSYIPASEENGADSFVFYLSEAGGFNPVLGDVTFDITVNPVNDDPIAQNDSFSVLSDNILQGDLVANDNDIDGDTPLGTTAEANKPTTNGIVTILSDGTFTYTPNTGYTGADSFTYTLFDGHGGSDTGTVNITIDTNVISGTTGNDVLPGTVWNDVLDGGAGNDTLNGGAGDDIYVYDSGNDIINEQGSGSPNDVILLPDGLGENDNRLTFMRFLGTNAYNADENDLVIRVDDENSGDMTYLGYITIKNQLSLEGQLLDTSSEIETLRFYPDTDAVLGNKIVLTFGTLGSDTIYGIASGGSSDDIIAGSSGFVDGIYAGVGNDTVWGGAGYDYIDGGSGDDTLMGEGGNDDLFGQDGTDMLFGEEGDDDLYGGGGDDSLYGADGNDLVVGGTGNDVLYGGAGIDTLWGGDGNDVIIGGSDNDLLSGDAGADTLSGGTGSDTFYFFNSLAFDGNLDAILDFNQAEGDALDVSNILDGFYDELQDFITDFVQITDDGTTSTLSIDQNGGGDNFVSVTTINGTGLNVEDLVANGNLITTV